MTKNFKKIKIAFVYDTVYPYIKGGAEKRYYELGKRLAKRGYEVHWYGMKLWKGNDVIKREGIYLHGICKAMPLYTKKGIRSIRQAIYFGLSCFKLIKEDFDVIDANQSPFFGLFSIKLICLLKRKKLYTTWNEVWGRKYWVEYMGVAGNIAYIIEWLSARLPDEIISISEYTTERIKNELGVRQKISTIPLGIDVAKIKKIKPSKNKSDVIYAGRLLSHKNVDVLVNAISLLKKDFPKIKCFVVGNGPEESNLKTLTKKLGLEKNIIFIDFLNNHDDLYALMKASKVFAFPSTREGFGLVALESNACGIPFVTSNGKDNATRYLVSQDNNGGIYSITSSSLAKEIKKFLNFSKKRGRNIYKYYSKNYDWNFQLIKILKVYEKKE